MREGAGGASHTWGVYIQMDGFTKPCRDSVVSVGVSVCGKAWFLRLSRYLVLFARTHVSHDLMVVMTSPEVAPSGVAVQEEAWVYTSFF